MSNCQLGLSDYNGESTYPIAGTAGVTDTNPNPVIHITGNADLITQVSNRSLLGDGTSTNPFIMTSLFINKASGKGFNITVVRHSTIS